jgi:ribA/ribD-fused uncharacterized protein
VAKTVVEFRGYYRFLSNFFACNVECHGVQYTSAESAYQASKFDNPTIRQAFAHMTPVEALRAGRNINFHPKYRIPNFKWLRIRLSSMRYVLMRKFSDSNPALVRMLLDTGDAQLLEGNTHGDVFWGVDRTTLQGENNLGKLLMEIRKLRKDDKL